MRLIAYSEFIDSINEVEISESSFYSHQIDSGPLGKHSRNCVRHSAVRRPERPVFPDAEDRAVLRSCSLPADAGRPEITKKGLRFGGLLQRGNCHEDLEGAKNQEIAAAVI
jgi:hypothetical protein